MKLSLLVIAVIGICASNGKRFDGDKVYRIYPRNTGDVFLLKSFLEFSSDQYDFWREPTVPGHEVDLHVNAELAQNFASWLDSAGIPFQVSVNDLQQLIDTNNPPSSMSNGKSIVGTFPTYDDTMRWMADMCSKYSSLTECGTVGKSYENRDINYIKISKATGGAKKTVMFESTIHAREWLSTATVVWIVDQLLTSSNSDVTQMLDKYDFVVVPITNPDGYVYSHKSDRMWRKTRSINPSSFCKGVDANRNWDYMWSSPGSSSSPCSDAYHGKKAFSEPETKALSEFISSIKGNMLAYFSFHAYSQYWLIPYGTGPKPSDFNELYRVGKTGTDALMAVNRKTWKVGNIQDVIYEASGGSIDWVKGSAGVKYTYGFELRPSRASLNGFVVSTKEIEPSGKEVWTGIVAALNAMKQ